MIPQLRLERDAPARWTISHDRAVVALTADAHGFTRTVPDGLWHALLLELAQRIHVATLPIRYSEPETAA